MPTPHDRWVEAFSDTPMTTPALQITTVSGDVPVSGAPKTIEVLAGQLDGAEEAVDTGDVYLTSSDYELMDDGSEQVIVIVFPNTNVPQGAAITEAYVTFQVDEVTTDADVTVSIYGEAGPSVAPTGKQPKIGKPLYKIIEFDKKCITK